MEDLRKKAPEVYDKMMESIGMQLMSKMRRDEERIAKIRKEGDRQAQGR
jgi:hypothetical protein